MKWKEVVEKDSFLESGRLHIMDGGRPLFGMAGELYVYGRV